MQNLKQGDLNHTFTSTRFVLLLMQVTNDSPRVLVGVSVSLVQVIEFSAQSARRRCVALVSRRSDANGRRLKQLGYTLRTLLLQVCVLGSTQPPILSEVVD